MEHQSEEAPLTRAEVVQMLQGIDAAGLTLTYQSEGLLEELSEMADGSEAEYRAKVASLEATIKLFKRYENELLPQLADKDEYLKNNSTHQAVHEVGWQQKFDANRRIHLDFIKMKCNLHSADAVAANNMTCDLC